MFLEIRGKLKQPMLMSGFMKKNKSLNAVTFIMIEKFIPCMSPVIKLNTDSANVQVNM